MKNFGINQVGTQIPKFQQPWRTLQVNRYDAFDRFRDEKVMPVVKKIAHYINEHGKKVTSNNPAANSGHRRAVQDIAAHKWYREKDRRGATYNEHYNAIGEGLYRKYKERTKKSNSQRAAGAALAGTGLGFLGPMGKAAGSVMGIPDLLYDWAASIDEPENLRNHAHTATNYAEQLAKIIPGKLDDYVAKAGNLVSNMDDAFSAFGQDMYNLNSNEE